MSQLYPIQIKTNSTDKTYTIEFQRELKFSANWKSVLQKARNLGNAVCTVTCCCYGKGTKQLMVRYLSGSDTYTLAKYPSSGSEHSLDCKFHSLDETQSGMQGYESGVVREKDGIMHIKLSIGMTKIDKVPQDKVTPLRLAHRAGNGQSKMSLVGLLHLLWSEGELNKWYPKMAGKRKGSIVSNQILKAAGNIKVGRLSINDVILVRTDNDAKNILLSNEKNVEASFESNKRLIIVTTLARYNEEKYSLSTPESLPINNFGGMPRAMIDSDSWSKLVNSFPIEIAGWKKGKQVVAIALVDTPTKNNKYISSKVLQMGLMMVTDNWIPIDSAYEGEVADKLTKEDRAYIKPLRYDAAESEVFPDFCLFDTNSTEAVPMEVFGLKNELYLLRKAEKIEFYDKRFTRSGWWFWDAAANPDADKMPPFPDKA